MTSVERARKFIQAKGKAIALTIVPLATLTVAATQSAKAGPFLLLTSGGCSVSGDFSPTGASCVENLIPGTQNGVNSLKLTGAGTVTPSDGSFASLTFTWGGGTNQAGDSSAIPLNWDFTVADATSFASSGAYSLTYSFSGAGGFTRQETGALSFTSCGNGSCASVVGVDNTQSFTGTITSWSVSLSVGAFVGSQNSFSVNIPVNSIDVNQQPSAAPEPTSMALGATGLLGLMFARFRRRKV